MEINQKVLIAVGCVGTLLLVLVFLKVMRSASNKWRESFETLADEHQKAILHIQKQMVEIDELKKLNRKGIQGMSRTHTFVSLDVPGEFYALVRARLLSAGYEHAVDDELGLLHMQGISLEMVQQQRH